MNEAYIYDAVRTPQAVGSTRGALYEVKPIDLIKIVINALHQRNDLSKVLVDDLIVGCTTAIAEQGGNIARTAALYANINSLTSGISVNRLGISGLEAVNLAASKIRSGWEQLIIAGGVESMSRVPIGSDLGPMFFDPVVTSKVHYVPQGISADLLASIEKFTRQQLDEYALLSYQRAKNATQKGHFKNAIIPVKDVSGMVILDHDEHLKTEISLETLANLESAYQSLGETGYDAVAQMRYPQIEKIQHLHTKGNSAKRADGAAAILIGNEAIGKKLKLKPRAKIIMASNAAVNATNAHESVITATQKALEQAKLKTNDIDLFEINETFSATVLRFQQHFDIDINKININGGAIALGHPLGATGAVLLGKMLDELQRQKLKRGLVVLGTSGGIGCATIIEMVD